MLREVADSTGLSSQATAAFTDTYQGPWIHAPGDVLADARAGRCRRCRFGLFWNWLRPMGKRRRDCLDCGAPVKYLGREHCCGWMRRLREHAAKTHCPACGRDRVLVPGSAAAGGSAFM